MRKFSLVSGLLLGVLTLGGCGDIVSVPPAHKGKILTSGGLQSGVKGPSTFRLPYEWSGNPKVILAETSDQGKAEKMEVFMQEDKLVLRFDVQGTYSVRDEEAMIDMIFERLTAKDASQKATMIIDFDQIYETYADKVVRTRSREVMTRYSIEHVLKNMDAVSKELFDAINNDLKNTPIKVTMLALANVTPPDVIIRAQEAAAAREIAIQQAEADKLVKLKEAEAALEVAKKRQQVELTEAETQVLVDKKLSEGVSDAWLAMRGLAALQEIAKSDNAIIFMPFEAMQNPALMIGASQRAMQMPAKKPVTDTAPATKKEPAESTK